MDDPMERQAAEVRVLAEQIRALLAKAEEIEEALVGFNFLRDEDGSFPGGRGPAASDLFAALEELRMAMRKQ